MEEDCADVFKECQAWRGSMASVWFFKGRRECIFVLVVSPTVNTISGHVPKLVRYSCHVIRGIILRQHDILHSEILDVALRQADYGRQKSSQAHRCILL